MTQRCKFVDGQGEPIGWADVPPMYGVVNVNERFYGRMFNGDEDKDKYPFIFAEADVLVLNKLEELKYEPTKRERGLPDDTRAQDNTGDGQLTRDGKSRRSQRGNLAKAKRGRGRGAY